MGHGTKLCSRAETLARWGLPASFASMGDIQNPHDAFVRSVFQEKENAMDLIRSALPQEIVNRLDLANLDVIDASFVDEEQRQSQGPTERRQ